MKDFVTNNQKLVAGVLLFALWTGLVIWDHAPVLDLVEWIKYAIGAVLGFHAITNLKGSNQ